MKDLLKKAFVLLSSEEKKILFALKESLKTVKDPFAKQKKTVLYLDLFWERLSKVKNVTIQTQNNQMGFGNVLLTKQKETEILFSIQGKWMGDSLQASSFNNVLRWSLDRDSGLIALEHLRYGPSQPVFLFHLSLVGKNCLQSVDSHLCSSDCYYGRIAFTKQHIRFLWRILGPRKNEVLYHTYS